LQVGPKSRTLRTDVCPHSDIGVEKGEKTMDDQDVPEKLSGYNAIGGVMAAY
jgi:hypothetical protein